MNAFFLVIAGGVLGYLAWTFTSAESKVKKPVRPAAEIRQAVEKKGEERARQKPAKVWSQSPVTGNWIEHDRDVSVMQALGGSGGGLKEPSATNTESHKAATPHLKGSALDR